MKIGQLVMLVKTNDTLPPVGATGEVAQECCVTVNVRVKFAHHTCRYSEDGLYCTPRRWLVPIDDSKGDIAKEDQIEFDLGNGEKLDQKDLSKIARRMLEELEEEDA